MSGNLLLDSLSAGMEAGFSLNTPQPERIYVRDDRDITALEDALLNEKERRKLAEHLLKSTQQDANKLTLKGECAIEEVRVREIIRERNRTSDIQNALAHDQEITNLKAAVVDRTVEGWRSLAASEGYRALLEAMVDEIERVERGEILPHLSKASAGQLRDALRTRVENAELKRLASTDVDELLVDCADMFLIAEFANLLHDEALKANCFQGQEEQDSGEIVLRWYVDAMEHLGTPRTDPLLVYSMSAMRRMYGMAPSSPDMAVPVLPWGKEQLQAWYDKVVSRVRLARSEEATREIHQRYDNDTEVFKQASDRQHALLVENIQRGEEELQARQRRVMKP